MPRVVSIYLPDLPIERIRRMDQKAELSPDRPLVLIASSGSKRFISAADAKAREAGIRVGMPAAKAQAMVRGLQFVDADPSADAEALQRIALWSLSQYSPIVAVDGTDGIIMDTEGADHLRSGELPMLTGIVNRFRARGLTVHAAIADTWGAAHACARATRREVVIIPPGEIVRAVERLPLSQLRLSPEIVVSLRTLGFRTIGELSATPRAPLALRFGPEIGRRLDQMFGRVAEPIDPIRAPEWIEVVRTFAEPIGAPETIDKYVERLIVKLIEELQRRGLGVRRTDLIVEKVDGSRQAIRAGTAKPARDVAWLTKPFRDRRETIEPGFGIEKLTLIAVMTEPLAEEQRSSLVDEGDQDITPLIDTFGNRGQRVYRIAPMASDVPERSVRRIAAAAEDVTETWVHYWPRPVRLLAKPEPIDVIALLPDHPPVSVTWRGKRRRVRRADGPERIFGEWWTRSSEFDAVRDYFVVEDESGERLWIFRSGDGVDAATGSHRWFCHGIFA